MLNWLITKCDLYIRCRLRIFVFCFFTQDKTNKPATEKEDRFTGTVTWRVYFDYWKAGGGFLKISLLIILFLGAQVNLEEIKFALRISLSYKRKYEI